MDNLTFALLFAENYPTFLVLLILSIFFHVFLIRRLALGLLDPIVTAIIGNAFAFATAIFVFYVDDSSRQFISSFLFSELAFWVGVFTFSPSAKSMAIFFEKLKPIKTPREGELFFSILWLVFLVLKLLQFSLVGVPLFVYNRLGMATGTGGLGVFQTGASMIFPILVFYAIALMIGGKLKRLRAYSFFLTVSVILFLDGSKSALVPLSQSVFLYAIFLGGGELFVQVKRYVREKAYILVVIVIAMAVGTIFWKEQDLTRSITLLGFRFIGFGDAFYQAYPNAVIETLDQSKFVDILFYPVMSTLRLVDVSHVPDSLGVMLNQAVEHDFEGGGANARHNILGLYLFGDAGFLFSFFIGALIGGTRRLIFLNPNGFYGRYFVAFILFSGSVLFTDATLGFYLISLGVLTFTCWVIVAKLVDFGAGRPRNNPRLMSLSSNN